MKTRCGFTAGALAMTTALGQAQTQEFNPGVTLPSQAVAKPLKVFVLEKDKADKVKATGMYYRLMIEHVRKVLADNRVVA